MIDRSPPQVVWSSLDEQARAIEHFQAVLAVHSGAMRAFELLAMLPEPEENLTAMFRLKHGRKSTDTFDSYRERAQGVLENIAAERNRGFQVIRGSALTAVCAAFEYAVKATFVSQTVDDHIAASGFRSIERQFAIADQLFQRLARNPNLKAMNKRVREFVLEHACLSDEHKSAFLVVIDAIDGLRLDEGFLVRNCLVHNGGRVGTDLAQIPGYEVGCAIEFGDGDVDRMVDPMRAVVRALEHPL